MRPTAQQPQSLSASVGERPLWRRYLIDPVVTQLKQGTTPEKIALSIVVGASISVFPVLGTTTGLCLLAGTLLRLNHPIVQLVNYLVYPLQLTLILVFVRVGETLFHAPRLPFSVSGLTAQFRASPMHFFREFGETLIHSAVAWLVIVPPVALMIYFALCPAVRALSRKERA